MPIVRGTRAARQLIRFERDQVDAATAIHAEYGDIVEFRLTMFGHRLQRPTIFAVGAHYNRLVLGNSRVWRTARITLPGPRGSAQRRLGNNLVSLNGPVHAHYRKLLVPPLRKPAIDDIGEAIGGVIDHSVGEWPLDTAVDMRGLARQLVRTVAIRLLFDGDRERGLRLADMLDRHFELSARLATAFPVALPGTPYRRLLRDAAAIERFVLDFTAPKYGRPNPHDLMAIIVNSPNHRGTAPSEAEVAGHLPILFAASYETCQTVLVWTLFLLAQHPHVAANLVDEVTAALGGGVASLARVGHLDLLDRVVKESMRLLPPVAYQMRVANAATEIDGVPITRGTRVVLSPFLTNRAPDRYAQPRRFLPERWRDLSPTPFEYLTFSAGPRACPGAAFGLAVVKVALAAILSRYALTVVPGTRVDRRIAVTMRPRAALPMLIRARGADWRTTPVAGQIVDMVDLPSAD